MRYVRDEVGEAALGVYHGPLDATESPRVPTVVLGSHGPTDSLVVEDQHRISSLYFSVRDYCRALGRIWRGEGGSKTG